MEYNEERADAEKRADAGSPITR